MKLFVFLLSVFFCVSAYGGGYGPPPTDLSGVESDISGVSSDLSDHESATGTNVHGLGTMSTQDTGDYYTASATDLLLAGKTDTNTTAALDDRVSVVETGKVDYTDSTYTDTVAKAASALQSESYTGDFKADGSVPMSGPFDGGGFGVTNLGSLQMPSMDTMTYTGAVPFLVYNPVSGLFEQSVHKMEPVSRTITVTTNESIQEAIDLVGKYLPSDTQIDIVLADGTHSITQALDISNFHGGKLILRSTDTSTIETNTVQPAVIDASGSDINAVNISDSTSYIAIKNLKIALKTDTGISGVSVLRSQNVDIDFCYIYGTTTDAGYAIDCETLSGSHANVFLNKVLCGNIKIYVRNSRGGRVTSRYSFWTGDCPEIGFNASAGSIVQWYGVGFGTSETNNITNGGLIVCGAGAILP